MVYLGRSKYSSRTGVYLPLIVAENLELHDGDLLEYHIEAEIYQLKTTDLVVRKSILNDPFSARPLEERSLPGR